MSGASPLASPEAWNLVAAGYAEELTPFFREFAAAALQRAQLAPESRILDVATGPGTLAALAAPQVAEVVGIDFSDRMLKMAREALAATGARNVDLRQGDGQSLPFEDATFDAAFSMFGLMFFPDRALGFAELARVLRPGGTAVVSSWTPAEESPLLATLFGAVREVMPNLPVGGGAAPLSDPDEFRREMEAAGFRDVRIDRVTHPFEVPSVDSFWASQVRSSAPVAVLRARVSPAEWDQLSGRIVSRLREAFGDGEIDAGWTAYLGVGTR